MIQKWADIKSFYTDLANLAPWLKPMANLVEQIEASPTVSRLYGWTSMHDLNVVQNRVTYPYDGPRLLISPSSDEIIEFRYLDTPSATRQWRRMTSGDDAFERLQRFADQLRWFPHVSGGES